VTFLGSTSPHPPIQMPLPKLTALLLLGSLLLAASPGCSSAPPAAPAPRTALPLPEDPELLELLVAETDFARLMQLCSALVAAGPTRAQLASLEARADDPRLVGLTNPMDLIIWDRIESGDLESYGHGLVSDHDLFTVGGRASWLLRAHATGGSSAQWAAD